jgi:hypothetical protein
MPIRLADACRSGQDAPVKQPSIERILTSLLLVLVFGMAAVSLASRLYLVTR